MYIYYFIKYINWPDAEKKDDLPVGISPPSPATPPSVPATGNFSGFATKDFTIAVIGNSPVFGELKNIIANKIAENNIPRTINVRKIDVTKGTSLSVEELRKCRVIVLSRAQSSLVQQIGEVTKGLPILIVSEKAGLTGKGAAICIYVDDEDNFKTKFELSKSNMQARELKVSHDLLVLADIVN